ncbi:MAG: hypothetical protein FWG55_05560 [Candidatus Bathyarchaeota archaeon]|nr:hypothetical protein [Candidatus Termiticorpusculum sp.]
MVDLTPLQIVEAVVNAGAENWLEKHTEILNIINNDVDYRDEFHHKLLPAIGFWGEIRWIETLKKVMIILEQILNGDDRFLIASDAKKREWRDKLGIAFRDRRVKCNTEYAKFVIANQTLLQVLTDRNYNVEFINVTHCCPCSGALLIGGFRPPHLPTSCLKNCCARFVALPIGGV